MIWLMLHVGNDDGSGPGDHGDVAGGYLSAGVRRDPESQLRSILWLVVFAHVHVLSTVVPVTHNSAVLDTAL